MRISIFLLIFALASSEQRRKHVWNGNYYVRAFVPICDDINKILRFSLSLSLLLHILPCSFHIVHAFVLCWLHFILVHCITVCQVDEDIANCEPWFFSFIFFFLFRCTSINVVICADNILWTWTTMIDGACLCILLFISCMTTNMT